MLGSCVRVFDCARKGHKRLDTEGPLFHQLLERKVVAHAVEPGAGDQHGAPLSVDGVGSDLQEVIKANLGLGIDRVRLEVYVRRKRPHGLASLVLLVVLNGLDELEVALECGVVLQHVQDEPLLNSLMHAIRVKGHVTALLIFAPEEFEGLVLRGGRKREVGDVCLLAACSYFLNDLVFEIEV